MISAVEQHPNLWRGTTRRVIFAVTAILLTATISRADSRVQIYSFADNSCGMWLAANARSRDTVAYWARGFITAYNVLNLENQVTQDLG